MPRPRLSDEETVTLPALRVPISVRDGVVAEAKRQGCSVPDYLRGLLLIHGKWEIPAQPPKPHAKPSPRTKARAQIARTATLAAKRCACPRPKPSMTSYGICQGCRLKR